MSKRDYEYGGIKTAMNGIFLWLQGKVTLPFNVHEKYTACCKIVVEYGIANVEGFVKKGHVHDQAARIARKIHEDKRFNHFTQWVLKNKEVKK